jgi:antitoxin component HigA of HigAB toxin-antitoxin module
LDHELKLD